MDATVLMIRAFYLTVDCGAENDGQKLVVRYYKFMICWQYVGSVECQYYCWVYVKSVVLYYPTGT